MNPMSSLLWKFGTEEKNSIYFNPDKEDYWEALFKKKSPIVAQMDFRKC